MQKFHDFSNTCILREINFGDSRIAKSAILAHSEALNFDFYKILQFLKAEICQIAKFRAPKMAKNGSFTTPNSYCPKLISRKI